MAHNLEQLGTASLDVWGGLSTYISPQDGPEGFSPRCFDIDFSVGQVRTRDGLASVYSYAGQFVGPNVAQTATDVTSPSTIPWSNPNGILGSVSYASVPSTQSRSLDEVPTGATNGSGSFFFRWTNPSYVTSVGSNAAVVALTLQSGSNTKSVPMLISGGFSVPTGVTLVGMSASVTANNTGANVGGTLSLKFNNALLNTALEATTPLTSSAASYGWGSTTDLWSLSVADLTNLLNDPTCTAQLTAVAPLGSGDIGFTVNAFSLTVYYTVTGDSDALQATTYSFSVAPTSGVAGITTTFKAYSSAATTLTIQLLKAGVPVGSPKVQVLTTVPTVYTLGNATDLWSTSWLYSDINSNEFGYQFTASGTGVTNVQDAQITVYITPGLTNFNYIKSYIQNGSPTPITTNNQTYTLALDADGLMWQENVSSLPNELSLVLSGIIPGSFANSATMDDREHILFSDLSIGTDRPRVYNGVRFDPLSQTGPGAPPVFKSSEGTGSGVLTITAYTYPSTYVITFTIDTAPTPVVGSLYTINGVVSYLNGNTYSVLGSPMPDANHFSININHADDGGASGLTGTATPAYSYTITSITQTAAGPNPIPFNGQELIWSAAGAPQTPGDVLTFYYGSQDSGENQGLVDACNSGFPVYVYITGAPIGDGTWLVTGHNVNHPPHESGGVNGEPYFTIQYTSTGNARYGGPSGSGPNGPGNTGTWQITMATVTTTTAITGLSTGDNLTIAGVTPATGWNNNWTVVTPLNSITMNITSTTLSNLGVATYGWSLASALPDVTAPVNGQVVTVINCTNSAEFNTVGVISNVTGTTFDIDGLPPGQTIPQQAEQGSAIAYGTQFNFDPGSVYQGTTTDPIFGTANNGAVTVVGGVLQPIGAGTRQGVVFFITENEYETPMSSPVTFTTSTDANFIVASQIPIGPPDTVARGIAFTEAGQNGVAGANFYVIEEPVTITVNQVIQSFTSTIINDNTTTEAKFTFTDAVLLNSREVDVQGDDLFNLIELGSSGWCVPYAGRMFYGLQLNKINNWTTGGGLTFDGGYLPNPGGNIQPLGWNITNPNDQTLLVSTVTGLALYIQNHDVSSTTPTVGLISQTAYQDSYGVPIIATNTTYSIRVACSCPSGAQVGNLVLDLSDLSAQPQPYGSFTIPLSSMTTNIKVFTGTLLTTPFSVVPAGLLFRLYLANSAPMADCEIDRIEVFDTKNPFLKAQVYGSYPAQPEAIDASSTGGVIDTTSENAQACMGGFVMHDLLYLLKTQSWYSTQDNPNSEPGGWGLHEVSNRVGTIGINSYDTGEEWCITACRSGIYGFDGGQPTKISQELWNLWEQINWSAGNTIVVRNDVVSKRLYVAIPLPTGVNPATGLPANKYTNVWLPNAPYNPAPVTPNVMLMLNYQGLADIKEMMMSPGVHTTINKIVLSRA